MPFTPILSVRNKVKADPQTRKPANPQTRKSANLANLQIRSSAVSANLSVTNKVKADQQICHTIYL